MPEERRWWPAATLSTLGAVCALGAPGSAAAGLVLAPAGGVLPGGRLVMQGAPTRTDRPSPSSPSTSVATWPSSAPRACGGLPGPANLSAVRPVLAPGENRRYDALIEQVARSHGHDTALIRAIVQVESAFNPQAISPKGAMGLMQVMPATAQAMGITNPSRLLQPAVNLEAGARLLRELLDHFNGSLELALAAYNAGESAVRRWGGIPPYAETEAYVDLVLQAYARFGRHPLSSGCQTTAAD